MADHVLPTITVNDTQYAKLAEVFGTEAAYQKWLVDALIAKIKQFEEGKVRVAYQQQLAILNQQEQDALAAIDVMLANLKT